MASFSRVCARIVISLPLLQAPASSLGTVVTTVRLLATKYFFATS